MSVILTFEAPTSEAAQAIGALLVAALQEELAGPRSGRWYPLPNNVFYMKSTPKRDRAPNYQIKFTGARSRDQIMGGAYQASAPGEAPASRTGRLRQSFYMTITMTEHLTYKTTLRSNVMYAGDLEFGTEKVDPRPFLSKAVSKSLPKIVAIQNDFLYRVLRGQ